MIKAIETEYRGYRFRSRLEARWAVFFDAARIPYEYEPEGFDLDDIYYLPDFYLPWFHCYLEIKPKSITQDDVAAAVDKLVSLFKKGGCCTALCIGDPADDNIMVITNKRDPNGIELVFEKGILCEGCESYDWGYTKHCITIALGPFVSSEPQYDPDEYYYCDYSGNKLGYMHSAKGMWFRSDLSEYKIKGRQARFEYGEKG